MLAAFLRFSGLAMAASLLAGCAGTGSYGDLPAESSRTYSYAAPGQQPLQCVPYARDHSGVKLYGDAWTWWDQAAGKFPRGSSPQAGSVMVLTGYAGPAHGHVAVVRAVVSPREIRVDHANWLDDGSIYVDDPVMDVSDANDWSQIRVFNIKAGAWGGKIYPVKGFIGPSGGAPDLMLASDDEDPARIARAELGLSQ
jgi:surface antigen